MRVPAPLFLAALAWTTSPAQDPSLEASRRLVQDFYTAHFRHGMGFDEASIRRKAKFLVPDLLQACLAKRREDAARGPDEAPDVDGDPFTDSQEYPDGFQVGRVHSTGGGARVQVTFTWKNGNPARSLTVLLQNLQTGWRIDDLRYPEGKTLRQLLKPASAEPR